MFVTQMLDFCITSGVLVKDAQHTIWFAERTSGDANLKLNLKNM